MKKFILLALLVLLPFSVNADSKLDQILASGELKDIGTSFICSNDLNERTCGFE